MATKYDLDVTSIIGSVLKSNSSVFKAKQHFLQPAFFGNNRLTQEMCVDPPPNIDDNSLDVMISSPAFSLNRKGKTNTGEFNSDTQSQ